MIFQIIWGDVLDYGGANCLRLNMLDWSYFSPKSWPAQVI